MIIKTKYIFLKALFLSVLFVLSHSSSFGQKGNIELVHSDKLTNSIIYPNAMKVVGNVHFRHENRNVFCDSAIYHEPENWLRAYGHVQINQADTLNLFCDSLYYDGNTNLGILRNNVRFRDSEFKMTTDSLEFDANKSVGYYTNWAKITSINQDLKLTSKKGYYYSGSKTFYFKDSVEVTHPNYNLSADTLEFNTLTETVHFHGPTQISLDSTLVYCKKGFYNTNSEYLNLWNGATIINNETSTLYADSLIYEQQTEIVEGFYNVSVYDSLENVQLKSNYLISNLKSSQYTLKKDARIYKYNPKDTLFLSADTIHQNLDTLSQKTIRIAQNNVVIINQNAVGICDSIYYNEVDSIIKLRKDPMLWQDSTQLSGDSIDIKLNNNSFDEINLHNNSLVISMHDSIHYDQLSGKFITASFKSGDIYKIFIDQNAQTLYYPSEKVKDSTGVEKSVLKGKNQLLCDQIVIYFKKSEVQKIAFIDKPEASFHPLDQIKEKELFLNNFIWKIEDKPNTKIPK